MLDEVNFTDMTYVKVGTTPGWETVYAYCDGELINHAVEANVDEGWVKYRQSYGISFNYKIRGNVIDFPCEFAYKRGIVQILYHHEGKPTFDVNPLLERVVLIKNNKKIDVTQRVLEENGMRQLLGRTTNIIS